MASAVTAVYKGTPKNDHKASVLLRSYDSRREPAPEFNCTIWQAGRATCASALAFKPIQIGQNIFLDEGAMNYNPAPQALDEAAVNEWPGREIGLFISVGTGKRSGESIHSSEWWEDTFADAFGGFADAKRRLITKIDGCETTHQEMLREHLAKRRVSRQNYFRLNVEVGVGEFGMNEWSRLAEISTSTRRYLSRESVQDMTLMAADKLAAIYRANRRYRREQSRTSMGNPAITTTEYGASPQMRPPRPTSNGMAPVELDAGEAAIALPPPKLPRASQEKYAVIPEERTEPLSMDELHEVLQERSRNRGSYQSSGGGNSLHPSTGHGDGYGAYGYAHGPYNLYDGASDVSPRISFEGGGHEQAQYDHYPNSPDDLAALRAQVPPVPPKTSLTSGGGGSGSGGSGGGVSPLRPLSFVDDHEGGGGVSPLRSTTPTIPYPDPEDGNRPLVDMPVPPRSAERPRGRSVSAADVDMGLGFGLGLRGGGTDEGGFMVDGGVVEGPAGPPPAVNRARKPVFGGEI